jgi:hypothetical protein
MCDNIIASKKVLWFKKNWKMPFDSQRIHNVYSILKALRSSAIKNLFNLA